MAKLAVASLAPLLTEIAFVQLRSAALPARLHDELLVADPKLIVFA
jgi:hypothetical protein